MLQRLNPAAVKNKRGVLLFDTTCAYIRKSPAWREQIGDAEQLIKHGDSSTRLPNLDR
jgi:hypothetical protein